MGSADEEKPSLEAPSFGLRRRKRARPAADGTGRPTPPSEQVVDPTPPAPETAEQTAQTAQTDETVDPTPPPTETGRQPTERRPLNGHLAAALAGLVAGVFLVLATYGGLQTCESVRGTTSCGGGPGFSLLALIFVLAVVIGAAVLRVTGVPSAGSISFLAVALVAVLSSLFLLGALDSVAGALVVGALSIAAYLLSHWVTARYLDTAA